MITIPSGPLTRDTAERLGRFLSMVESRLQPGTAQVMPNQRHGGGYFTGEGNDPNTINKPFRAKLTAYDGSKYYSWTEQTLTSAGVYVDLTGGRSGTATRNPAFEASGTLTSYSPTTNIVELCRAYYDDTFDWVYVFTAPGGTGSLTVMEVDGAPTLTGISTLRFDQADGFVVTNPAAGIARVDQTPASATEVGYVTIGTQTFAGNKTFTGNVTTGPASVVTVQNYLEIGTGPNGVYTDSSVSLPIGGGTAYYATYYGSVLLGAVIRHTWSASSALCTVSAYSNGASSGSLIIQAQDNLGASCQTNIVLNDAGGTPTAGVSGTILPGATSTGGVVTALGSGSVGPTSGGTGFTTYTTGDTLYAIAANTLSKLAIGSTDDVLIVAGGVPTWGTVGVGGGGTGMSSYTTGDILYASAANALSARAIGSNDDVLYSNGTVPQWGPSPYTATTAGDWAASTPPTTVATALDRIAAALTILGQPP